jgi:hypothetical protein
MDEQEPLLLDTLRQEGRIGKFFIGSHLLREIPWEMAQKAMANFFVVHAEQWCMARDGIEHMAYSPLFGVTDPGDEVPYYNLTWEEGYALAGVSRRD